MLFAGVLIQIHAGIGFAQGAVGIFQSRLRHVNADAGTRIIQLHIPQDVFAFQ